MLLEDFFSGDFAEVVTEFDAKAGETVWKVRFKKVLPNAIKREATNTLVHTRSSIDQTMFAARNVLIRPKNSGVNYPWASDPPDLEKRLLNKEIAPALHDVLRAHEPYFTSDDYPGGDDVVRTLANIANDPKHKAGLTVGTTAGAGETYFRRAILWGTLKILNAKWDTRKNEAEFMRLKGRLDSNMDHKFAFIIRLNDPRLPETDDVWFVLGQFIAFAERVHDTIKAKCIELSA